MSGHCYTGSIILIKFGGATYVDNIRAHGYSAIVRCVATHNTATLSSFF